MLSRIEEQSGLTIVRGLNGSGEDERVMELAEGEHVFHQGTPLRCAYEILDGTVMIYKCGIDGTRQLLGLRFSGDLLGIAGHREHDCSAQTAEPSKVVAMPWRVLERRLDHDPALAKRLLSACRSEVLQTREQLFVVGSRSAIGRVAAFLLQIATRSGAAARTPESVRLPLTRREIGEYLGLTLETVSRTMTKLAALKIIEIHRADEITIVNRPRLVALGNGECEGAARGRFVR